MSEDSRGKNQRRLLEMLAAMMNGESLDRHASATRFKINPDPAFRLLRLLGEVVPGVEERKRENRVEFYFDHNSLRRQGLAEKSTTGFVNALAASFASAFARVFGATEYGRELLANRARVISELSATRQKHFADIGRKVFVRCGQEELLEDRENLLNDVLEAVLKQRVARMRYRRFGGTEEALTIKPYSIGVYEAHLYVVSGTSDKPYYPFRFARILEFELTDNTFRYPSVTEYDPEVAFGDSIGIFVDPEPCLVSVIARSRVGAVKIAAA